MWNLVVLLATLHVIRCACPTGFDLIRDGKCTGNYTKITAPHDESLSVVISKCGELGGYPLTIHSEEDNAYWSKKAPYWVVMGLVCNYTSKQWEWVDGSPLDFKPANNYESSLDEDCDTTWHTWYLNDKGYWSGEHSSSQMTTDVLCTVPLHPPVPAGDGCDSFEDDTEDGVCYQIGEAAENWQGAQLICQKAGANLASIHSAQENSYIRRLAVSKGATNGVYLGATISGKGNNFSWIDGSDWNYENFHPGFPEAGLGECLALDTSMTNGYWLNTNCSSLLPVACTRAQKPVVEPFCSTGPWKEEQLITSPGFPFTSNTFCDYFLTVEAGKKVEAVIELEANTCCDFLTIYDGQIGGALLANLTGEIRSKVVKTNSSNTMRVNWQPNGGVNVRGLAMSFRGVLR